jgi:hypothetical protein
VADLSEEEIQRRLDSDPDFVNLKRFGYSLKATMDRYEKMGGPPDHVIARGLGISERQLQRIESRIIRKLRTGMGVNPDTGKEE